MRQAGALLILLATGAASSCTCATAPEPDWPPAVASRRPGLQGRVVPSIPVLEGASAVVELRVVPEAAMVPFVASRLAEARKAQDRVATERDRLGEEARAALARSDRAD